MKRLHFYWLLFMLPMLFAGCSNDDNEIEPEIGPEAITLKQSEVHIYVGDEITLDALIYPTEAGNWPITWSSTDETVATVTQTGVVKGVGAGSCYIYADLENGLQATCIIKVASPIKVDNIYMDCNSLNLKIGEKFVLMVYIDPNNATNKELTWYSDNEQVATVDDGIITAINEGRATITAITTDGGKSATCIVNVRNNNGDVGFTPYGDEEQW